MIIEMGSMINDHYTTLNGCSLLITCSSSNSFFSLLLLFFVSHKMKIDLICKKKLLLTCNYMKVKRANTNIR